jgi:hypothetical protein
MPDMLNSSQVLVRFLLRLVLLSALATMSSQDFGKAFATLLTLTAVYCAVSGALRQEAILGQVLTHWDEAAAYVVISCLPSALS